VTSIEILPFGQSDRAHVAELVDAHAEVVVPGLVLPGGGATHVARQRGRATAAARVVRDGAGAGRIGWFLVWPDERSWPDASAAGDALLAALAAALERAGAAEVRADGAPPGLVVAGLPDQWPHVSAAYERAGFVHAGGIELLYAADVRTFPRLRRPPVRDLRARRDAGPEAVTITASLDGAVVGRLEAALLDRSRGAPAGGRWAEVRRLEVAEPHRRRRIATWLAGRACDWLAAAGAGRLLAYAGPGQEGCAAFYAVSPGFVELTRARRGWVRGPLTAPPA